MTNVMDVNRELIRATQPLRVGDSEHLGLVWLRNGRVYNLHTVKVRDKFTSECNDTTMNLVFRLTLDKPYIVFDLAAPMGSNVLAGGQLTVRTDALDVDIGLVTPKIKKSDEKVEPQVPFADVPPSAQPSARILGDASGHDSDFFLVTGSKGPRLPGQSRSQIACFK
ncbi:hypothetical protein MTO96_014465 [Rhipicephalus appendiculatus]